MGGDGRGRGRGHVTQDAADGEADVAAAAAGGGGARGGAASRRLTWRTDVVQLAGAGIVRYCKVCVVHV